MTEPTSPTPNPAGPRPLPTHATARMDHLRSCAACGRRYTTHGITDPDLDPGLCIVCDPVSLKIAPAAHRDKIRWNRWYMRDEIHRALHAGNLQPGLLPVSKEVARVIALPPDQRPSTADYLALVLVYADALEESGLWFQAKRLREAVAAC